MKRARLIYNPTAGRELVEKRLPRILDCLEQAGYETSCRATQDQWSAAREAKTAAERGFDAVIAAGGDGTIHEVVNGLASHPHPPKLGILPGGTTNDFARALKLPRDLCKACNIIAAGKTSTIDIGKIGSRYFINVAAAGRITEVTYEAPSRLKTMMGPLAYYAKAIEKLGSLHKPFPIQIKTPRGQWESDILLLIIANSVSVGGFEKLAPSASLSDGLLDVLIIPKTNIPDLLQLAALAYKGEHIYDSRIIYFQTEQLDVDTSEPLKLNLDGEWGGKLAGRFELLPQHLEIFCP
ncbi:diacylglycerol kinase [Paenactinomyces guangxiensis]|uniref:Diacylglycerol kinase n=1 Tax=Paenactinomyces guangxiensis TaxID=1490290 RepID=A0A7W1WT59_9BACL|nr:diacylglycerol kinase [Paenactinomyces guangxiensis]MBA4495539.1 diacylglycerol kinase [Paenactinomyces guangxiensis]MBH8592797.1 diacylglycerol kinase [Paenactinomyces guangxiensis]